MDTDKVVRVDVESDPEGIYIEVVEEWIKAGWMFIPDRVILSIATKRGLVGAQQTIN